jgi:tetratricopeptide (TPR) repeat protein
MKRYTYLLCLFALLTVSCHGPKFFIKEAQKFERVKDYDNAVANYAEAYSMDPSNRDAKKGFKKTGQKLLDELLDEMRSSYDAGQYKDAVAQYKKTDKYYNNVKSRGVELDFPEDARTMYKTALENYLNNLYLDAANAISRGDYSNARINLDELRTNDPGYEGLQALERSLEVDPIYINGQNAYNKGQKLIAIQYFNQVNKIYPGYRETNNFLAELSKLPKQFVSLFPIENKSREMGIDRLIYKGVEKKLFDMQSSLLAVGDETMVQNELIKANKNSQPPYDDNTVIQIAKSMTATKAVLISVTDLSEEPLANSENFQIAYAREKVVYWDPYYGQTTNYQWREVKYKEVEEGVKYAIYIKVRIFDPVSGMMVYNDVVTKSVISKVKYARYDGDYSDLYPTMGYVSQTELNKWRNRFSAEKDRKSKNELIDILVKAANDELSEIIFSKLN